LVTFWVRPAVFVSGTLISLILPLAMTAPKLVHLPHLVIDTDTVAYAAAIPCLLIAGFLFCRLLAWDEASWLLSALTRKLQAIEAEPSNSATG
jgi:hypothetical protein